MAKWLDSEYWDAFDAYRDAFPDSGWGMEGCGISADEAIALMRKSVQAGIDYLEPTMPAYPDDAIVA